MTAPGQGARPVVMVSSVYPPHLGGLENVAHGLADALAASRPVAVLTTTSGSGNAPRRERRGRLTVRRYRSVEIAHTPIAPGLLAALLRAPRRAIVHAHVAQAFVPEAVWLTSAIRRRGFVAHFHLDIDASGPAGRLLPAYKRLVFGPVLRAAERVVVLSPEQADFVQERYGVSPERVVVIPNGVVGPTGADPAEATGVGDDDGVLRLLYVGRIAVQKNIPRLVEAFSRLTEPAVLAIVGDGEGRAELERTVAERDLTNIRVVGPRRGAALAEWYRWAEAFVLASDKEGMPLVVLEAMLAGLPVVATDVPGTRELVGGVGLLAAPDPAALAAAIDRLAGDAVLRADLAQRSLLCAAGNTWESRLAALDDVYGEVAR
jgi:phosphatidylinositol alpha-mannosyltransferase